MNLSLQDLQAEAAASGFSLETLDKVIRLMEKLWPALQHVDSSSAALDWPSTRHLMR